MGSKTFNIYHARIKREVEIANVRVDKYNPTFLIVDFNYTPPSGYPLTVDEIIYGIYIDKELVEEKLGRQAKVQLYAFDVIHKLEIFVHPHEGFYYDMLPEENGNKIRIRFRARNPSKKDIDRHVILGDNASGSYESIPFGEVDAVTGEVSGRNLKSGAIKDL
jgi:hypothetical protein